MTRTHTRAQEALGGLHTPLAYELRFAVPSAYSRLMQIEVGR